MGNRSGRSKILDWEDSWDRVVQSRSLASGKVLWNAPSPLRPSATSLKVKLAVAREALARINDSDWEAGMSECWRLAGAALAKLDGKAKGSRGDAVPQDGAAVAGTRELSPKKGESDG